MEFASYGCQCIVRQFVIDDVCAECQNQQCIDYEFQPYRPAARQERHDGIERGGNEYIDGNRLERIVNRIVLLTNEI